LISDWVATLLTFLHISSGLVLFGHFILEPFLELLDFLIDPRNLQVVRRVIRLLERLFRHRRHNRVNCHKQLGTSIAPLTGLILGKAGVERASGYKWLVLVRHFFALLVICLVSLLLLCGLLLLRTLVAIVALVIFVFINSLLTILVPVGTTSHTSGSPTSSTLVLFRLSSILGGCTSALASVASRGWSLGLSVVLVGSGLTIPITLPPILFLPLLLRVFLLIRLAPASVLPNAGWLLILIILVCCIVLTCRCTILSGLLFPVLLGGLLLRRGVITCRRGVIYRSGFWLLFLSLLLLYWLFHNNVRDFLNSSCLKTTILR